MEDRFAFLCHQCAFHQEDSKEEQPICHDCHSRSNYRKDFVDFLGERFSTDGIGEISAKVDFTVAATDDGIMSLVRDRDELGNMVIRAPSLQEMHGVILSGRPAPPETVPMDVEIRNLVEPIQDRTSPPGVQGSLEEKVRKELKDKL